MLEAGIVSEETYIEQGEYWKESYHPLIKYVLDKYKPDLAMVGNPVTDEVQHQFLGLVTKKLPNGANNPSYDDVAVDGSKDGRVKERERFIREAYEGSDETMRLAQERMRDRDLTTFVSSDHGFAPQFLAHRRVQGARRPRPAFASADRQLPPAETRRRRPRAPRRSPRPRSVTRAARRRSTSTSRVATRRHRAPDRRWARSGQRTEAEEVARIKAAFLALKDPNDWTGDGKPENWKVIDRVFTKAEARYIPNGAGSTADMSHPTRTGDVVAFSYPPYQYDAATPGTLIARSAFFGQHGYVPDIQDLKSNTNMRATFLAGGTRIEDGDRSQRALDRPRADGRVPARHPGAAAQPGRRPAATSSTTRGATRRSRSWV